MLLGTLGASLLGNLLTGKGAIPTSQGQGIHRARKGKGVLEAVYGHPSSYALQNNNSKMDFQCCLIL